MPKMKTRSSAKKRFRTTAKGHLKRQKAYKSHILTKKTRKRKRNLRKATIVEAADRVFQQLAECCAIAVDTIRIRQEMDNAEKAQ